MEKKSHKTEIFSKYWRINRSHRQIPELALSLKAIRKAAGHIGRNVKPIYWKGMVQEDDRFIILDPEMFNNIHPIPHKIFDFYVGQVVLEGMSSIEFNEWVRKKVIRSIQHFSENYKPYLEKIIDAAECIYIAEMAKPHVWSLYLSGYFSKMLSDDKREPGLPPSPESLAHIWKKKEILSQALANLHNYYHDPLFELENYADEIREITLLPNLNQRREKRVEVYGKMCLAVSNIIAKWEIFNLYPDAINLFDEAGLKGQAEVNEGGEEDSDFDDKNEMFENNDSGLDQQTVNEISVILDEKEVLSQSFAVAVLETGAKPMEVYFSKGEVKSDIYPDMLEVNKLKKVFKKQELMIQRLKRSIVRRGLAEGKIDPFRLYRIPLDGKVFKKKQAPGLNYFWQICILADSSASMSGKEEYLPEKTRARRPWEIAEKCFVSLAEASKGQGNLIDIYAYNAERNRCNITQLFYGGSIYSVSPSGRTPSGQAIMAVAQRLNRKYKKSMIVHITDGASNCGLSLSDSLNYCRVNQIEVFTIGCGCNRQTKDFLRQFFLPSNLYFLKNINNLAEGLEYLFKKTLTAVLKTPGF